MTLTTGNGNNDHEHLVLTIGDLPEQARDLGPVLESMQIKFIHAKTGEQGLTAIDKRQTPFSLVICDQRLNAMKGTQLLARVKQISPETIRFLITGYSDMDTIISAVNKGAVHRYISKPWNQNQMAETISSGITRYEYHLESERLFALAKTQNGKLYELNCELMETTQLQDKKFKALEEEIAAIAAQLKEKTSQGPLSPEKIISLITKAVEDQVKNQTELISTLYAQSITGLYEAFSDLALRNGIEMPEPPNPEPPDSEAGDANA